MSSTLYENSASLQELLNTVNDLPVNRELTADDITEALGYFPADNIDLEDLEERQNNLVMVVSAIPGNYVANSELSSHNTSNASHNDIRLLISGLTSRLDALANSDDTTLDQLSEIVAYIKANKSLIDSITTSKVNVADIIDNLTTSASNKPLSAKMGVQLKTLIDAIKIPTTLPASDVYSWAKQPNKPTYTADEVGALPNTTIIPTVPTNVSAFTNDAGYAKTSDLGNLATKDTVAKTDLASAVQTSLGKADTALQSYTETDPTVPYWAKATSKPTYTKSEVGLGNVDNVKQYSVNNPPPYPVTKVNNKTGEVSLSASDVGADASGTASYAVSTHNSSASAHSDIREEISQLSSEKVDKSGLTLGVHNDGLVYLFVNGSPQGNGLEIKADVIEGDVFGYVDENNNIVLNGNLADGTYSIKYEMNGETIDIGNLVLDSNVYYSITNTLTNCTNSNSATQAAKGENYSATITANSGFELKSVTVTMGGSPVSVSGGTISIAEVTGNIVITAIAEEVVVAEPTNFFKSSPTVNTNATAVQDAMVIGGRFGSDKGYRADGGADCLLTNYIPVQNGDEIVLINITLGNANSGFCQNIGDTKAFAIFTNSSDNGVVTDISTSGFKVATDSAGYVRICGKPSNDIKVNGSATTVSERYDCSQIIINIKRNGAWL